MKKKLLLLVILISIIFSFTACGTLATTTYSDSEGSELIFTNQSDADTYPYTDNPQFVAVSYQNIYDGTLGLKLTQYVDLNTGTMYLYTESNDNDSTTFTPLINPDGTAVVYDDLETLRNKYHWNN